MDKEEFFEWIAYYNIEPWGSIVDGYRSASIASTTANVALATVNPKKLRSRPYKIDDFLIGVRKKQTEPIDRVKSIKDTLMALSKKRQRQQ
jgi:hypothetical protein